jgi:ankyrin repeat protein
MLDLLLELGADFNGPRGEDGSTVDYAIESEDQSIAQFVLDHGAECSELQIESSYPSVLFKAVKHKMSGFIPVLLARGADLNKTEYGWTALGYAWHNGDNESGRMLQSHGAAFGSGNDRLLMEIVGTGDLAKIREVLELGIDPNTDDGYETAFKVIRPLQHDTSKLLLIAWNIVPDAAPPEGRDRLAA